MNREEARKILAVLRLGERDKLDPFFAEALRQVESDPELARWFAEEKEFDRAFTASLTTLPIPPGLRTRIRAAGVRPTERRMDWWKRGVLAAAAIVVLALLLQWLRSPAPSLDEFRGEMISFVKLAPPLELETTQVEAIRKFLSRAEAPVPETTGIPPGLKELDPAGCRVLFFRGHKVTLICFKRGNGKLTHLLVLDRSALPQLAEREAPKFASEGDWMTAAWQQGEHAYVLAAQGDRALLEGYLKGS